MPSERLVRPDEVPKFGQVWRWMHGEALMVIAPYPEDDTGERWVFLRVDGYTPGTMMTMFWRARGSQYAMSEWTLVEDD